LAAVDVIRTGKAFLDLATGNDDGTVPFLNLPGRPFIVDPQKYFEVHKKEYGIDVELIEGEWVEIGGKTHVVQNGVPVPAT
jgi:hypothetical protein